jgi:hypothetical protein
MARPEGNTVRKEDWEMATPVQGLTSMPVVVDRPIAKGPMNTVAAHPGSNRSLAPLVLIGILLFVFFVSPYLPIGVREYISALVR